MKMRLGLVLLSLASLAVGCGGQAATGSASAESGGEVTVALVAPMSGFAANYGPEARQGVDLALAEFATENGVVVKVVEVDEDVTDPTQTVQRVTRAVEDGAEIVLGPVFGSSQQAVAPALRDLEVPLVTFLGGSENLAGDNGTGIVWPAADERTAGPMGEYAATELGFDNIATLAPDYAYGRALIQGLTTAFESNGGTVAQQQWVPLGTTDMLQYATQLDRSVDALAMWLVPSDAASFVTEVRNLGIEVPLLMVQGVFDPTFQEIGGQLQGELGMNEYNPLLENDQNARFLAAYDEEYGGIPNQTTAFAYTAMQLILQGLEESGGDPGLAPLRQALAASEWQTVIGPAGFGEDGLARSNRYIVEADEQDGVYVWRPLRTYEGVGASSE